ncbi:hypothetical protein GCM10010168_62330 [Actinoplanes ianthinogenes]|uniref:Uncharacterized protein n=1 Tax=Actinoplanes ianthinogenes TaxID=122358 RepID=A0ABM7LJS9_9ACTN|nr:hypothetical protein [Actinoplanes ianthinogenes]BCJ39519.1 hypothetical protein Aiant_01760 [Actinoplanes ianthinogenes]GGR35544.1 hypothetical protein GCM10010168_62330 [Actinoplanes ianthinogenes]
MYQQLRELLEDPAYRAVVRGYLLGLDRAIEDAGPEHPAAALLRRDLASLLGDGLWDDVRSLGEREILFPYDPSTGRPGLRLDPSAPLPADLVSAFGQEHPLVVLAAQVLAVAERDGELVDLLPTRDGMAAGRFDQPATVEGYRAELLERMQRYGRAADPRERLFALLDVDEALCSVVHRPPAAPGTWWAGLTTRVRDEVFRAAAAVPGARVTELSGRFADLASGMTRDDAAMIGPPGMVLGCLRLWASVDGRTSPGRVIIGTR